jgi:hypothetical protein
MAKLRAEIMANPEIMETAEKLARSIVRAIPDYDVEKSFLARWPDDDAS